MLCLEETDLDLQLEWNRYQKLKDLEIVYPSFRSLNHLFEFHMPNVTNLDLHWYVHNIDFLDLVSSFPNLENLTLFSEDATNITYQSIFQLKKLIYFSSEMDDTNEEDLAFFMNNVTECLSCSQETLNRTAKSCSVCSLVICILCAQESLVCRTCMNVH